MSHAELYPLFPSATHPAIPIAARILSTLRNLTGPGRGNDLKAEERAALVGVSAVLGCEKIQSKDLPQASAQKASSVSPAHFRSALSRARRILSQVEGDTTKSPSSASASGLPSASTSASTSASGEGSRRSPRKPTSTMQPSQPGSTDRKITTTDGNGSAKGIGGGPSVDPLSPFQTPKKKFRYSSGIDVSDLLRSGGHPHTPTTGSPLRQSQTPGTVPAGSTRERVEGVERTPTKRTKFHPRGVDLSTVDVDVDGVMDVDVDTEIEAGAGPSAGGIERRRMAKRRNEHGMSAFMALRPGSSGTSRPILTKSAEGELPEEEQEYLRSIRVKRRTNTGRDGAGTRVMKRRDWTCKEVIWGSGDVDRKNRIEIERVLEDVTAYLEKDGRPVSESSDLTTLVDLLTSGRVTIPSDSMST